MKLSRYIVFTAIAVSVPSFTLQASCDETPPPIIVVGENTDGSASSGESSSEDNSSICSRMQVKAKDRSRSTIDLLAAKIFCPGVSIEGGQGDSSP